MGRVQLPRSIIHILFCHIFPTTVTRTHISHSFFRFFHSFAHTHRGSPRTLSLSSWRLTTRRRRTAVCVSWHPHTSVLLYRRLQTQMHTHAHANTYLKHAYKHTHTSTLGNTTITPLSHHVYRNREIPVYGGIRTERGGWGRLTPRYDSDVTVVLEGCDSGVTVVLQWCCIYVTVVCVGRAYNPRSHMCLSIYKVVLNMVSSA
jgi:hypothetical protein